MNRPLCTFDIEATGVDVAKDRIVSIAALIGGEEHEWLVNPGCLMTDEVIAIHGITNEMVADKPLFAAIAREVHEMIKGCDLCGFNLLNFDVPLLWEEFRRSGIEWNLDGVNIIDVGNIFKKKEERTLSAAVKFYLGREHDSAHDAAGDVRATYEVLGAQLNRYDDLEWMDHSELAAFSAFDKRVDLAGKIILNDKGEPIYNIGQSKGKRVVDDPGFGRWMLTKDFSENTKQHLRRLLK